MAIEAKEREDQKSQIRQSFVRGMVKLFVLQQAGQRAVYGGALSKSLHNLGYHMSPGSLYPLLHALEQGQLLQSRASMVKGRVRKYYELTTTGRSCLLEVREELAELVKAIVFDGKLCLKQRRSNRNGSLSQHQEPQRRRPLPGQ